MIYILLNNRTWIIINHFYFTESQAKPPDKQGVFLENKELQNIKGKLEQLENLVSEVHVELEHELQALDTLHDVWDIRNGGKGLPVFVS